MGVPRSPALLLLVAGLCVAALAMTSPVAAQTSSTATWETQSRFNQLYSEGRFGEAAPLAEKIAEQIRAQHGERSSEYGASLYQIGNVLIGISRNSEAEAALRRALAIFSADPRFAQQRLQAEVMLATTLVYQNKLEEGLPLMQRAATAFEAAFGLSDPRTISTLNNLAQTLHMVGRGGESEPVYRKLIATLDPSIAANLTNLGTLHGNLAALLNQNGRRDEALVEMRKSVDFLRRIGNPNHRFLAIAVSGLGLLEQNAGNYAVAEALYRESLESAARGGSQENEVYAGALMNLAVLQRDIGKPQDAEASTRKSLELFEKVLGAAHPKTGSVMNGLAVLLSGRGAWPEALTLYDRATEIAVRNARTLGAEDGRLGYSVYGLNPGDFPAHMRAIYHVAPNDPKRQNEAFGLAQRSLNSSTAAAISRMAARAASPGSPLAQLIREQQDLLRQRMAADQAVMAMLAAKLEREPYDRARAELERVEQALSRVGQRLKAEFPDHSALDAAEPVPLTEVQKALKPREAMVAFVEVEGNPSLAGEVHAWVITAQAVQWVRLDAASQTIAAGAASLRCGLDAAAWRTLQGHDDCARLTGVARSDTDARNDTPLPFDVNKAHELYLALFRPIERALQLPDGGWRELLVVTSGPLATIPLATLVTEPPPATTGDPSLLFRQARWLGQRQAITVLPAISSLTALRRVARQSAAANPMIGFGNPELDGAGTADRARAQEARAKQSCATTASIGAKPRTRSLAEPVKVSTQGALADVTMIRAAAPLPETADEICAIALELKADVREMRLGARAREAELKALSASGRLATFRVVHFATHGLLAGQLEGAKEPGLILTPPAVATQQDDGYLSASEIASLKLDADWVILSACNTAGGQGGAGGTDALSGLARAFFYAGARALLVSHWEVDSQAAVNLITATVGAIAFDRRLGRSEALRRAMAAMIGAGDIRNAHPSFWAPFIVVGEGGATQVY